MSATADKPTAAAPRRSWIPQPLQTLRAEIDSLCNQALGEAEGWVSPRMYFPTLDVHESDDAILVEVDLPGVRPEDVEVHVNEHVLTIRGERQLAPRETTKVTHKLERRRGTFSRSVPLPSAVQEDKVAAEYRDGVLTVMLPKTAEARGRKVPILAK